MGGRGHPAINACIRPGRSLSSVVRRCLAPRVNESETSPCRTNAQEHTPRSLIAFHSACPASSSWTTSASTATSAARPHPTISVAMTPVVLRMFRGSHPLQRRWLSAASVSRAVHVRPSATPATNTTGRDFHQSSGHQTIRAPQNSASATRKSRGGVSGDSLITPFFQQRATPNQAVQRTAPRVAELGVAVTTIEFITDTVAKKHYHHPINEKRAEQGVARQRLFFCGACVLR